MIVSHTGKLIFFHNPKAAGASVHASLHHFHDKQIPGWGIGADGRKLAHYGIDEFAALHPEQWARINSYQIFSLYRDPQQRFFSSFAQYSRMHGEVDIRLASAETTRSFLFRVIERLAKYGQAEAVLPAFEFTPFRAQWIYGHSHDHNVAIASFPVREIEQMYRAMEARLGAELSRAKINEREAFDLPGPVAAVLQRGGLVRKIAGLPGAKLAKAMLMKSSEPSKPTEKLDLSDADRVEIGQFVTAFYAADHEWIAEREAARQAGAVPAVPGLA